MYNNFSRDSIAKSSGVLLFIPKTQRYTYTPSTIAISSYKTYLKHLQRHYTYHLYITIAYCKQTNAPEGSSSNSVRQREIVYVALPNIAWQRLLETGLDDLCPHPCRIICCADLCAAPPYAPHQKLS